MTPLDANGKPLKVGDTVLLKGVILNIARARKIKGARMLVQYSDAFGDGHVCAVLDYQVEKRK